VFVLPQDNAQARIASATRLGYTLDPVMLGSQQAAIVSDMDAQELANFGRLLAQPARNAVVPGH
jgi:hypothetical protein